MTQVSSAVDVLWDLYMAHPEKLSKVDWEYLTWKNPNPLSRSSLIDGMHKYIKPVNNKYEEQWRKAHKKILKKVFTKLKNYKIFSIDSLDLLNNVKIQSVFMFSKFSSISNLSFIKCILINSFRAYKKG